MLLLDVVSGGGGDDGHRIRCGVVGFLVRPLLIAANGLAAEAATRAMFASVVATIITSWATLSITTPLSPELLSVLSNITVGWGGGLGCFDDADCLPFVINGTAGAGGGGGGGSTISVDTGSCRKMLPSAAILPLLIPPLCIPL